MGERAQIAKEIIHLKNTASKYKNLEAFAKYLNDNPESSSYTRDNTTTSIKFKLVKSSSKNSHIIFYDTQ